MIDRAQERFGDTGAIIVTENEWLAYINAAYRQFVRQSKWPNLITETTAVIAANGRTVALPAAALQGGVADVFINGMPLEQQPAELPIRRIMHFQNRPTTPIYYQVRGTRISVLPAWAAGGTLTIAYFQAPTALTTVSSPVIPETYHDAIIAGALAQAFRDDENKEQAEQYQAEFDTAVAAAMGDHSKSVP